MAEEQWPLSSPRGVHVERHSSLHLSEHPSQGPFLLTTLLCFLPRPHSLLQLLLHISSKPSGMAWLHFTLLSSIWMNKKDNCVKNHLGKPQKEKRLCM